VPISGEPGKSRVNIFGVEENSKCRRLGNYGKFYQYNPFGIPSDFSPVVDTLQSTPDRSGADSGGVELRHPIERLRGGDRGDATLPA